MSKPARRTRTRLRTGATIKDVARHAVQLVLEKCEPTPVASRRAVRRLLAGAVVGVLLPPPLGESSIVRTELGAARLPVVTVAAGRPPADAMCVPRDLTVVGFDDTLIASTVWPELTTIQQPIARMAERPSTCWSRPCGAAAPQGSAQGRSRAACCTGSFRTP